MLFFKRKKNEVESDSSSSLPDGEESVGVTNKNKQAQPGIDNQSIFRGFVLNGSLAQFNPGTVNTSSLGSQFAVPLSWHNLSYTVNGRKVLRGLTGTALPSRCLAIMGSSGAGKTTFLNAVCDRLATSSTIKLQGTRQLGDVEYRHQHCKAMGFVAQDDILAPLETPEGALSFSLRVRRGTTKKETMERVEETLQELRLVHCRSTIVGIPGLQAGLSGGERKRCSIGVELICDPKILLLDEPTSGLDSVTSAKIVHLLNTLARTGRTVVYTIHQPTSEMLNYFDDIMLLTQGRCVYHGTMENSLGYFESIGYRCPETFTPTDFYMTLLQDPDISKILIKKWKSYLKSSTRTPHSTAVDLNPNPENSSTTTFLKKYSEHFGSTPWIQFTELARRNTVELTRNYMFIFSNFVQAAFFGLVIGLIFLNVGPDIYGVQDRQGVLFMTTMNRAMGQTFIMINGFMAAKPLYIREQRVGAYSPPIYFLAKLLVGLPLRLVFALLECCIIYWMVGFYNDAGAFFYFFSVVVMITEVASALGFAFSSWFGSLVVASGLAPVVLLPLALAGGLLASTDRLRPYWYWLEKPSMVRHSYILLSRNEFKRLDNIYCDSAVNGEEFCKYQPKNGMEVLQLLGFEEPQSADWVMWMSLGLLFLIFNTLANIALCITARKKF